ncbi:hypothetical protein GQ457_07G007480 [Hibiscus cannabinus]
MIEQVFNPRQRILVLNKIHVQEPKTGGRVKRLTLIHPNKQESKVRKLLPQTSKNRTTQFPGTREVGAKRDGLGC